MLEFSEISIRVCHTKPTRFEKNIEHTFPTLFDDTRHGSDIERCFFIPRHFFFLFPNQVVFELEVKPFRLNAKQFTCSKRYTQ